MYGHFHRILKKVNSYGDKMRGMEDKKLRGMTKIFKSQIKLGVPPEVILPEAFAVVREAMSRVLGIYPYDVQILGAIAMFEGKLIEMKTGEGKTYTASMPLYLNALTGESTILVTMNPYLAVRDGRRMGKVYEWLGLSCGIGVEEPGTRLGIPEKKQIYGSDIVYTTSGALGFDYLMENLGTSLENRYLRPFHFVIIDEVDSVLLDSAQTPLVISGAPRVQSNLYGIADSFVSALTEKEDYEMKDTDVWLTERGMERACRYFGLPDLYDGAHYELLRHITLALRAHFSFQRDRNYVVERGEVKLLDAHTGRIVENTKLQSGQHQAIEAKEGAKLSREKRSMASITFQDFFNMFPKIAGMSGTITKDAGELKEIYGLDIFSVPTNRPVRRIDMKDEYFTTIPAQIEAVMDFAEELHRKGQPVLIIADSIQLAKICSWFLLEMEIPHNVLDAHSVVREAEIIAEAGRKGNVTIATAVAGRGTDILLGEGVARLGGLAVLGVGRMENRRLELQARGRAGRQGDPGLSKFFVCLEDEVVQKHGKRWLDRYLSSDRRIRSPWVVREVRRAQRVSESQKREARKNTAMYGESMRLQRNLIYAMRTELLQRACVDREACLDMERALAEAYFEQNGVSGQTVMRYILDNVSYRIADSAVAGAVRNREEAVSYVLKAADDQLEDKLSRLEDDRHRESYFRMMTLKAIDESWIEQVDYLQQLQQAFNGRQYRQRNLVHEYHMEARRSFERMKRRTMERMMRNILMGEIYKDGHGRMQAATP